MAVIAAIYVSYNWGIDLRIMEVKSLSGIDLPMEARCWNYDSQLDLIRVSTS